MFFFCFVFGGGLIGFVPPVAFFFRNEIVIVSTEAVAPHEMSVQSESGAISNCCCKSWSLCVVCFWPGLYVRPQEGRPQAQHCVVTEAVAVDGGPGSCPGGSAVGGRYSIVK